jgi:hypothetical protein
MPRKKPPWYRRLAKWFLKIVVEELVEEREIKQSMQKPPR